MKRRFNTALVLALGVLTPLLHAEKRPREKFEGYVEWVKDGLLVVDGQQVRIIEATQVNLKGGLTSIVRIPPGSEAKGEGLRLASGVLEANTIELKPNGSALFEGHVAAMFDQVEQEYLRKGRVFDSDEEDHIIYDYGRLLESGPEVERVRRISSSLVPPYLEPEDFRVYVVVNDEWNAMAAPNRSLFVFTGLLQDLDDDEMAIILGHELVHATHEHSRRQYKRSFFTDLFASIPLAIAEAHVGSPVGQTLLEVGATVGLLAFHNGYSRKQEDQADRVGLRYAHEAGYDVSKGSRLWRRFAKKYGNDPKALSLFFGSHSPALDRAKKLEREIALNYSGPP